MKAHNEESGLSGWRCATQATVLSKCFSKLRKTGSGEESRRMQESSVSYSNFKRENGDVIYMMVNE